MEEDKNYISLIHGDLTRATQVQHGMPDSIGVMSIKTANRTILEASLLPTPRALWDSFWYEGELSCLFADSNVGKSILAVQIADRIARTDNVLYLDFELSEKQFSSAIPTSMKPYLSRKAMRFWLAIRCWKPISEAIMGGMSRWLCKHSARFSSLTIFLPVLCYGERRCGRTADDTAQQPQKEIRVVRPCAGAYPQTLFGLPHYVQ